jgi:hypothetical protein
MSPLSPFDWAEPTQPEGLGSAGETTRLYAALLVSSARHQRSGAGNVDTLISGNSWRSIHFRMCANPLGPVGDGSWKGADAAGWDAAGLGRRSLTTAAMAMVAARILCMSVSAVAKSIQKRPRLLSWIAG